MAYTIAFSGKGGSGKTTLAALTLHHLCHKTGQAVLAVDADPNATLGAALGVPTEHTIAEIREDTVSKRLQVSEGMSKENLVELLIEQSIVEQNGFDLLTMGRPEGPGCYCYVNNLLRRYIERCAGHYPFVVVDNEAGMEHLSRRTTHDVDVLFIVAEPTRVGIDSAKRVFDLAEQLPITVKNRVVVVNKAPEPELSPKAQAHLQELGLDAAAVFVHDSDVYRLAAEGAPLSNLPEDNPTRVKLGQLLESLSLDARVGTTSRS